MWTFPNYLRAWTLDRIYFNLYKILTFWYHYPFLISHRPTHKQQTSFTVLITKPVTIMVGLVEVGIIGNRLPHWFSVSVCYTTHVIHLRMLFSASYLSYGNTASIFTCQPHPCHPVIIISDLTTMYRAWTHMVNTGIVSTELKWLLLSARCNRVPWI